jgi:hypothetical protein
LFEIYKEKKMNEAIACADPEGWKPPSLTYRLAQRLRRLKGDARYTLQRILFRAAMALAEESNTEKHAKRELRAIGYDLDDKEEGPNKWMTRNLLDLLRVFSTQGHSGFSAPHCVSLFEKLARFKPLGPLTGEDSEWMDHGDGMFQNIRCGAVFKQPDRFDGQAYFLDGKVFREPNGSCFTNRDSMTPVTFPYTPATVYVDVPERE